MKYVVLFLFFTAIGFSQETESNRVQKKIAFNKTIQIDSVSINPFQFQVSDKNFKTIDSSQYIVDFGKGILMFKDSTEIKTDTIVVNYSKYPNFITKKYFLFDERIIVENNDGAQKLISLGTSNTKRNFTPFDGLETSGSISRGFAIGNNQNSSVDSELDLQISGKISENISLRASLQDSNVPLQEGGYSQKLNEFDQVFVELFSENWLLRAGDVNLENTNTYFGKFNKKVQGIYATGTIKRDSSTTTLFVSGAIVKGQYATSVFNGQEGNQGPYKLSGPNGELFILLVTGSETIYVNGLRLERGEQNDYIIDYNAGEIIFNATYPITSEMRISVEYQYSDRNYSRIIAYGGGKHESQKLKISAHVYTENDAKNQPLQQNLSEEQVDVLQLAGDDTSLMTAPSATPEAFSENRILYKKEVIGGIERFVFSIDENDPLFQVRFSLVGDNSGNYILTNSNAISNIYEYVDPIGGVLQGNFEPIIQLFAPTKLQMAVVNSEYNPNDKTKINIEIAGSKNDLNLFSDIDDEDNNGWAGKLIVNKALVKKDSAWNVNAILDIDYVDQNFNTIERLYRVEFDRDWNLEQPLGNQNIIRSGVAVFHPKNGVAQYAFEHLQYSENYNGNRHVFSNDNTFGKFTLRSNSSFLKSSSSSFDSKFLRFSAATVYQLKKGWVGVKTSLEDNQQKDITTNLLSGASQKYNSYETFVGRGDSTDVFVELGYKYRVNDSLRAGVLSKVNTSNTYYLKSRLLNKKDTKLAVHANFRILNFDDVTLETEKNLNSQVVFHKNLFKQFLRFNSVFEANSGVVPQQDFTFVEVDEGQGYYTWIDYNSNGVQELNEFEIAQFQDQATYVKILLPNQIFIKTEQNKWSSALTINPKNWSTSSNTFQSLCSKFYNQTTFLIDKKTKRENDFSFNLFKPEDVNLITLSSNFKNALFFKRGKQHYSTTYTYIKSKAKNSLSTGFQETNSESHQLQFIHKFMNIWLFHFKNTSEAIQNNSENFASNNYDILGLSTFPKLSYLAGKNAKFDVFYEYVTKDNQMGNNEQLEQQRMGVSFSVAKSDQVSFNGEFNYYVNNFEGSTFSPVAYQMLEGLESGKNMTWSVIAQKKLTKYLDLNLTYFGRKTETSKTIHTGNIQLKAFF